MSITIHTVCKEGICPICGTEFEYGDRKYFDNGYTQKWSCPNCGASGKESYTEQFDGVHLDVVDGQGNNVTIEPVENASLASVNETKPELPKLSVGMRVIMEPHSYRPTAPFPYYEGTIESIGRKYFYVRPDGRDFLVKFDMNWESHSPYGLEYYAHPNIEVFMQKRTYHIMASRLHDFFNRLDRDNLCNYEKVRAAYAIFEENGDVEPLECPFIKK